MNKYIKLSFLFILLSCGGNKDVFWCGDHACVNKAEKENYFKKNMIVEIKKIDNKQKIESSKVTEIIQQGKLQNKKQKKLSRREQKQKIKQEKKLAKEILKLERQRAKDEKKIRKRLLKEEKLRSKNEKKNI